ncbi:MAG: hypothetical protein MRY75_11560 [Marivita sp.]|uniref:hypothetical protein n=1 Tax=Marivita sp. TaxID=2003365 RepID=UPI0025BA41B8|nr:hypothetical protein [Marivita sp.]MCI5111180.1 hypothetical protein [Marivita sp.]
MKPDFALTLSFEGISLLRRVSNGWALIGDVALDAADLRGVLAELRSEADALSPKGGQVKLVIPNEQIKYLSIPDTGQTGDVLQQDIRAVLDGATPYAVDDLQFDWSKSHGTIHIAAVAKETLDEAETFAKSHHFNPVSFVAVASEGAFDGEVFFGPAAGWDGTAPERDATAIRIVDAPAIAPSADVGPASEPSSDPADEAAPTPSAPEAEVEEDAAEALAPGAAADVEAGDDPEASTPLDSDVPDAPTPQPTLSAPTADPSATPSFASIRASRTAPDPTSAPAAPRIDSPAPDAAPAPRLKLGGARKSTRDSDVTSAVLQVDATEEPVERKGFGFFSRRKSKALEADPAAARPVPPVTAPTPEFSANPPTPRHDPEPARAAVARIAAMRAGRKTDPLPAAAAPVEDERARMTVFGARTEPQIGGKPRFLGLMLTSALLIFLLAVAAWASVFLDDGLSRFFDREDATPSIARMPDVELLPLDGSITAAPEEDETVEIAALDVMDAPLDMSDGLSDVLPPPAALTPEEADARYAATGIWQRSPEAPTTPTLTTLDDLYVASIDGEVQQFDAVALPGAERLRNDQTYLSQPNPAPPGTTFTLDERGLVVATPEGAVNPDGVRIFAGLPPVVPPQRTVPDVVPTAPDENAGSAVVAPELEGFRPRVRPEGLIEGNERAQLGGRTLAELAALRPAARPETLKAQEEESQPDATQFAVAQSVAPVTRPRDFAQIVERSRARQEAAPAEVTQVAAAAVAPRTVQPSIPSTANVARQATVTNAINLRRINLIGVYGKPSNRRALVRLSNGRYQKVQVGDRLDGGRVAAIGDSELRYSKNGRNVVLGMPDG